MASETGIAWADSTFNPWIGCTKVSTGCDHCYASVSTPARSMRIQWGPGHLRHRTAALNWGNPLRWNARPFYRCLACGWRGSGPLLIAHKPPNFHPPVEWATRCPACNEPTITEARRRVFCGSLCDVFDNEVPPEWRVDLFALIESTPNLDWLLLTKRIGNAKDMMFAARKALLRPGQMYWPPTLPNVWLGATIVNQEEADRDIPKLLATPAAKRFVSYEPALGPVDFTQWLGGADATRTRGLQGCADGGDSDRPGRHNLAGGGAASGPMERRESGHPVRAATGRERDGGGLFAGSDHDRREAISRARAPACIPTFQGADPRRPDGEPHERRPVGQSSVESGIGNSFGAEAARDPSSRPSTRTELPALSWVIVGGESDQPGMKARPFDIQWARDTVRQCRAAGVACFVKQVGSNFRGSLYLAGRVKDRAGANPAEWAADLRVREFPR